jgi:hydroxymethylpyrimidine/phosphomethylpyrimidine kinase
MPGTKPVALTIAGSDPSGGAGVQADLKTFHQFGVYGEAAITLITVQNTRGVQRIECLDAGLVADQIRAVIPDIPPAAAKTGALGNAAIIQAVAELARDFSFPLVVDPVMVSTPGLNKPGVALLAADGLDALKTFLLPHAFLLTPNLDEASLLVGGEVDDVAGMRQAAEQLCRLGPRAVLVKGGHLGGEAIDATEATDAIDILYYRGAWTEFVSPRIRTRHTHGTGCTFSAAITASLASGHDLLEAVRRAKSYITAAIRNNPELGSGSGPLDHHALF